MRGGWEGLKRKVPPEMAKGGPATRLTADKMEMGLPSAGGGLALSVL